MATSGRDLLETARQEIPEMDGAAEAAHHQFVNGDLTHRLHRQVLFFQALGNFR